MPLIALYSPKGGVGKTTLCANLGYSFSQVGLKSLAIDFDSQNALKMHYGLSLLDNGKLKKSLFKTSQWLKYTIGEDNYTMIPHGQSCLYSERNMIKILVDSELNRLVKSDLMILIDLASADEEMLNHIVPKLDMVIIPILADTASLCLLPKIESLMQELKSLNENLVSGLVLNQMDYRSSVSVDVEAFLKEKLEKKLLGIIHRDHTVLESHSNQDFIYPTNPVSVSAFDISLIAQRIISDMNINIGNGQLSYFDNSPLI